MYLISNRSIKTDIPCYCGCDVISNVGTFGQRNDLGRHNFPHFGKGTENGRCFSGLITYLRHFNPLECQKNMEIIASNTTSK